MKFSGLAALFAAGFLAAGVIVSGGRAQDTTTTETTVETTTAPGTTATVERTTTRKVIVPTTSTTESPSSAENGTPTWVWVLLGILALGLVALLVVVLTRRGGEGISGEHSMPIGQVFFVPREEVTMRDCTEEELAAKLGMVSLGIVRFWKIKAREMLEQEQPSSERMQDLLTRASTPRYSDTKSSSVPQNGHVG